jgi:hypothetical protein
VRVRARVHDGLDGTQKFIDTAGRVDKFNQRMAAAQRKQDEAAERKRLKEELAASEA